MKKISLLKSMKNKIWIYSIPLFLAVTLTSYFLFFHANISEESITLDVYFCPEDNCERLMMDFFQSAEKEIHCAIYDLTLNNVTSVLSEKSKSLDVMVLQDQKTIKENNPAFIKPIKRSGLMHNKFCIVDGNKTLTGSFNPTSTADENDNNIIIIKSRSVAENYNNAFLSLSNLQRPSAQKKILKFTNHTIENYFCPKDSCKDNVISEISNAKKSIYFMTFSFTSDDIAESILKKHSENIPIKGIYEKSQLSDYSTYEKLKEKGIDVIIDKNRRYMHHKVFIIDNVTVITGSFNPSNNADRNNDENIMIIHNSDVAEKYALYFDEIYLKYK